jgi:hypothetical protein
MAARHQLPNCHAPWPGRHSVKRQVGPRLGRQLRDKSSAPEEHAKRPPSGQFGTLDAPNGKNLRKLPIELRQRQSFSHLLANPLIVGDWVGASGHEERLQEFLERLIQAIKRLKIQAAPQEKRNGF